MSPIGIFPAGQTASPITMDSAARQQLPVPNVLPASEVQLPGVAPEPVGEGKRQEALQDATERMAKLVNLYASDLEFSLDDELGQSVVKVIDRQSKEVIRQIPSEVMLKIARDIDQMVGVFLDQSA